MDTTDIRGNGTDGRAFLTLHGARGSTSEMELSSYSDTSFERGSSTDFSLNAPDVGVLKAITVRLVRLQLDSKNGSYLIALMLPGQGALGGHCSP